MSLEEAVKTLLELPQFKEDQKTDAKLRVYAGRLKKEGASTTTARELLLRYGFIEDYKAPKK